MRNGKKSLFSNKLWGTKNIVEISKRAFFHTNKSVL